MKIRLSNSFKKYQKHILPHNIKLWVYLTPIPEHRRRLCRIWPFPNPPCHHDRGCSCCSCFLTPHTKSWFPTKKCFLTQNHDFPKYKWLLKINFLMAHTYLFRSIVLAMQIHFLKRKMTDSTQSRISLHFSTYLSIHILDFSKDHVCSPPAPKFAI